MSWVKIDDLFPDNLKIAPLSDAAFRAHVTAICYASRNLTDGYVPLKKAKEFAGRSRVVQELVPHLWEPCGGGYMVHDYLAYNANRETVLAERERAKERMQAVRSARVRPNKPRTSPNPTPTPDPNPDPKEIDTQRSSKTTTDLRVIGARNGADGVAAAFGQFGKVTSGTSPAIDESIDEFGLEWVQKAVRKAAGAGFDGEPGWGYVDSILQRWKKQGKPDDEMEVSSNGRVKEPVSVGVPRRHPRGRATVSDGNDVERYLRGEG